MKELVPSIGRYKTAGGLLRHYPTADTNQETIPWLLRRSKIESYKTAGGLLRHYPTTQPSHGPITFISTTHPGNHDSSINIISGNNRIEFNRGVYGFFVSPNDYRLLIQHSSGLIDLRTFPKNRYRISISYLPQTR